MHNAAIVSLPGATEETVLYHKGSLDGGVGERSSIQSIVRWLRNPDVVAQHCASWAVAVPAARPHKDGRRFSWPRFSRSEATRRRDNQEHGERDLNGVVPRGAPHHIGADTKCIPGGPPPEDEDAAVLCSVAGSLARRPGASDPFFRGDPAGGPLTDARGSCPAAVFAGAPPAPTLDRALSTPAERTITLLDQKRLQTSFTPVVLNNCDQILPLLYLGGVDAVANTECVVEQGIRAVVCCLRDLEYPAKDLSKDLEYYRVDVEDISREPIRLFFQEATEFIHSWVSREQPVLVHCRAGVSRSASVVMAYLMTCQGYSLHDAFFLVRSRRSCVRPNVGFMEQLCEYEEAQRGTDTTVDINKYTSWYTSEGQAAVPDLDPE